jgi:hypothetical protein
MTLKPKALRQMCGGSGHVCGGLGNVSCEHRLCITRLPNCLVYGIGHWSYPIQNGHLELIFPLKMVIFHS